MTNELLLEPNLIRQAITQLVAPGKVFEVRIIRNNKAKPLSGYFMDADELLKALNTVDLRRSNVYITLQEVNNDCFSRIQSNRFVENAQATSDADITGYNWLFIDLDPVRTTGVSSSMEELQEAFNLAKRVQVYLTGLGFYEPVKAVSGNGAHLLYRINLAKTVENSQLVAKCLEALSALFDNDKVKIDTVNFNPARVCKLYGTLAQKGASTAERPHRMSHLVGDVKQVEINKKMFLEKLAEQCPVQEQITPARYNNYSPGEFDLEQWLNAHGLQHKKQTYKDGAKYVLSECPFDSSHKAPDSAIFKSANGAIGFKCLHNSCAGRTWQDVRVKFEPDAYDKKYLEADKHIEEGLARRNRDKQNVPYQNVDQEANEPEFLTMAQVMELDEPENEYIKTGIRTIDLKMAGLQKSCISVLSGLRGAAKSTVLSMIMLNAVEAGQNVVCYSGELTSKNFWKWLCLQAAGKNHTIKTNKWQSHYIVENAETERAIATWMGEHLWLYNNNFGNRFKDIEAKLKRAIAEHKADLVVIDNMMALEIGNERDQNLAQTNFVWALKNLAKICNVHVIFVAHPRKSDGFLRLDDVSGSGNITNVCDNAFIIHRVNEDFKRLTKQMFKWADNHEAYAGTNVIEIVKDRHNGNQDVFIPLWFEKNSKRLLNDKDEYNEYSWLGFLKPTEDDDPMF